jgi:hypothetical protein
MGVGVWVWVGVWALMIFTSETTRTEAGDVQTSQWLISAAIWYWIAAYVTDGEVAVVYMIYSVGHYILKNGFPPYQDTLLGSQSDYLVMFIWMSALLWLCDTGVKSLRARDAAQTTFLFAPFVGAWAVVSRAVHDVRRPAPPPPQVVQ